MKALVIILGLCAGLLNTSCKKEYICECTNPYETLTAFRAKDKKKNAEKRCEDYYKEKYSNVALNETSCRIR